MSDLEKACDRAKWAYRQDPTPANLAAWEDLELALKVQIQTQMAELGDQICQLEQQIACQSEQAEG